MKRLFNISKKSDESGTETKRRVGHAENTVSQRNYPPKEGGITFDAIYLGVRETNKDKAGGAAAASASGNSKQKYYTRLVPINIQSLTSPDAIIPRVRIGDTDVPVYTVTTTDGNTITLNVAYERQAEKLPGSAKHKVIFSEINNTIVSTSVTIANYHMIGISTFSDALVQQRVPPLTVVRVYNAMVNIYKGSYYLNADAIHVESSLNKGDVNSTLRHFYSQLSQPGLPGLAPLLAYSSVVNGVTGISNMTIKEVAKHHRENIRKVGQLPMPVVSVPVVQRWVLGQAEANPEEPETLLNAATYPNAKSNQDDDDRVVVAFIISAMGNSIDSKQIFTVNTDKQSCMMSFNLRVLQPNPRDRSKHVYYRVNDLRIYSDHFGGLGYSYPPIINNLLRCNPIPCDLIFTPNLIETIGNASNGIIDYRSILRDYESSVENSNDPMQVDTAAATSSIADSSNNNNNNANDEGGDTTDIYADGGYVTGDLCEVNWRIREYVIRHGIPVTRNLVDARYNNNNTGVWTAEEPPNMAEYKKKFPIVNPYDTASPQIYNTHGMVTLDEGIHRMPDETLYDCYFYVLPAVDVNIPEEFYGERDDPFCDEEANESPMAIVITPEEGDAFVKKNLSGSNITKRDAWYTRDSNGVPRWLFFLVVTPKQSDGVRPPFPRATRSLPRLARWRGHPKSHLKRHGLCTDMEELRMAFACHLIKHHDVVEKMAEPMEAFVKARQATVELIETPVVDHAEITASINNGNDAEVPASIKKKEVKKDNNDSGEESTVEKPAPLSSMEEGGEDEEGEAADNDADEMIEEEEEDDDDNDEASGEPAKKRQRRE